jgi:hypothetical protein
MADNGRELGYITRFKGSNFHLWKFQMRAITFGKYLMDVVDATEAKPAATEPLEERTNWRKRDNQAYSLLTQAIDESILKHVMACVTFAQIWDKLELLHEQNATENVH